MKMGSCLRSSRLEVANHCGSVTCAWRKADNRREVPCYNVIVEQTMREMMLLSSWVRDVEVYFIHVFLGLFLTVVNKRWL